MFVDAQLYQEAWRERNNNNFSYPDGDQWTAAEEEALQARGQQATVLNICRPTLDMVCAMYSQRKSDFQVVGREMSDDELAGVLTELLKQVYDQNDYDYYEGQLFRTGVTGGMGWMQISVKEDELKQSQIHVDHIPWEEVYWDPYFRRPDGSDARYIIRQIWMDRDTVVKRWPTKADALNSHFDAYREDFEGQEYYAQYNTGSGEFAYYDHRNRRVAINEVWYRDDEGRMRHCIYTSNIFLKGGTEDSQNEMPYRNPDTDEELNAYPLVPYIASRNRKGEPQGVIHWIKPIQDTLNKVYSKWQWNICTRQVVAEEDAVDDPEQVRAEVAKPNGFILTRPGKLGGFQILKNIEESAHLANMMQFLVGMGQRVSGVNDALLGMGGVNARSAEQEASRLLQGAQMQTAMLENLMFSKKRIAHVILRLMGLYYTDERTVRVTQPNGTYEHYLLNQEYEGANGENILYNIENILRYDVVLRPVAAYNSVRQNTMTSIVEAAKSGALPAPIAAKLIIELVDIPDKQRIIQELEQFQKQQEQLAQQQMQAEMAAQAGG
jgi:hypothetical protein